MMKSAVKQIVRSHVVQNILAAKYLSNIAIKNATIVFLYHEVSDTPSIFHRMYNLNVPPAVFEKQIQAIRNICNVISPKQLLHGDYKRPAAMITFDDGAAGYFENAVPILQKYNCPSTIFLNMGPIVGEVYWSGLITFLCEYDKKFIDTVIKMKTPSIKYPYFLFIRPDEIQAYLNENEREKIYENAHKFYGRFASRNQLVECKQNDLVSFGNHLYNHFNCGICTDEELCEAYIKNQHEIEKYCNATKLFSYPFGQEHSCYNERTTKILGDLGAQAIFTAHSKSFQPNGRIFHRVPVTADIKNERKMRAFITITRTKQCASFLQ